MSQPTPPQPGQQRQGELRICYRAPGGAFEVVTLSEAEIRRARARELGASPSVQLKTHEPAPEANPETPGNKKRPVRADSWSELRKTLRTWDQPQLLGLIQDLCAAMPEVRAALAGRFAGAAAGATPPGGAGSAGNAKVLEKLRSEIRVALRGRGAFPKGPPKIAEAKKVADRYHAVSADADGAITLHADLLVVLMEIACEFGGTDDREADAMFKAAQRVVKLLPEARDLPRLAELCTHLKKLLRDKNLPGYGLDDLLADCVEAIEGRIKLG